jgi:hypothetical protein
MGHHYVPQYYLKGFSQNDGKVIYAYDKIEQRYFGTSVDNVAKKTKFYSSEVETYLANIIEGPANEVLKKIRERLEISPRDKQFLSDYMTCMIKRVPAGKEKLKELAPRIAERVRQRVDRILNLVAVGQPEKEELIEKRRIEIDAIIDQFEKEPPEGIWLTNIPPEKTPRMLDALSSMTWRFLVFDEYPAFLTSDNPVFYFEGEGIGKPESEVTIPISSHIALWANWRRDPKEGYFPTTSQVVKELNRRTCSIAARFVYHLQEEDWVLPLVTKSKWKLNRLI